MHAAVSVAVPFASQTNLRECVLREQAGSRQIRQLPQPCISYPCVGTAFYGLTQLHRTTLTHQTAHKRERTSTVARSEGAEEPGSHTSSCAIQSWPFWKKCFLLSPRADGSRYDSCSGSPLLWNSAADAQHEGGEEPRAPPNVARGRALDPARGTALCATTRRAPILRLREDVTAEPPFVLGASS